MNSKFLKFIYFCLGLLVMLIIFATGILDIFIKHIDPNYNKSSFYIDGKKIEGQSFIHENTPYISLETVELISEKEIYFDPSERRIDIITSPIDFNVRKESGSINVQDAMQTFTNRYPKYNIYNIKYGKKDGTFYYKVSGNDLENFAYLYISENGEIIREEMEIRELLSILDFEIFSLGDVKPLKSLNYIVNLVGKEIRGDLRNIQLSKEYGRMVYKAEVLKNSKIIKLSFEGLSGEIIK